MLWFDIPFCDAEVLYGSVSLNNLQFELTTEDPKTCPLKIVQLEIFGTGKREFNFKDKVKKLEKLHNDKLMKAAPV